MVTFPQSTTVEGFFEPERFEADVYDCEVVGEIPSDLDGAFVRVGSDWYYPPRFDNDAAFSEDGFISRFRFKDGTVDFKGRWVRTPRFKANSAAKENLFGVYRNPFTDDPRAAGLDRTVANTAPLAFAGKLFAMKEDALPYEIDPNTLATIGPYDFGGGYKAQTFSAHPKIDPESGEMICYGYEATGLLSDDLWLYSVDRMGQVTWELRTKVPYVSIIHDIAITPTHIIVPFGGYTTGLEWLQAGNVHWGWDDSMPFQVAVIPRGGEAKDVRWFTGPNRALIHTFNGRTEGNKIVLDAPIFDANPFPFFPNVDGSPWDPTKGPSRIRRQTYDLSSQSDQFTEEILLDQGIVDLVRIDERYMGHPYRYGYFGYSDPSRPFDEERAGNLAGRITNCYGRYDFETGQIDASYFVGDTHSLAEPCFVPRNPGAPEGDGYLIGVAANFAAMRSELVIADTRDLAAGDVARILLPFRSTTQVHGKWFDARELPFGEREV
jgi:carotenoid cleavage dioxygenase-like enzyme